MRADDNIQEEIDIIIKAIKLSAKEVNKAINWYLENRKKTKQFEARVGETSISELNLTESSVKFMPNEVDTEMMKLYSKEFKKLNIHFAVEKVGENTYKIAFAGRNIETVEHGMKQVVETMLENKKSRGSIEKVNELVHEVKEKVLKREKTRNDREAR